MNSSNNKKTNNRFSVTLCVAIISVAALVSGSTAATMVHVFRRKEIRAAKKPKIAEEVQQHETKYLRDWKTRLYTSKKGTI